MGMATATTQTDMLAAALAAGLAPTKPQLSTAPAEKAMVSRAVWTGVLQFSGLNLNVKTYKAAEAEEVKLNMIHACNHADIDAATKDGKAVPAPVYNQLKRSAMSCPVCSEEVASENILKGYQFEEGKFVVISDDDRKSCNVSSEKSMPIDMFVDVNELDPVYFASSEYIIPDKGFETIFAILRSSMVEQNTVAIATTSQRGREEVVAIRPYGSEEQGGMIISYLYFDNEVRGCDKWTKVNLDGENEAQLVEIATQLVDSMKGTFDIKKYQNTQMRQLKGLINDRMEGKDTTATAVAPAPVADKKMDLMGMLKASLASRKSAA